MACKQQTLKVRRPVFTDGVLQSFQFITFARVDTKQWRSVRVSVLLEGSSGLLNATAAAIYANTEDGFASATAVDVPATPTGRTSDGQSFGASWFTLDVSKQMAEIGVQVTNASGNKRQMGTVTLTIDLSEE